MRLTEYEINEILGRLRIYVLNNVYIPTETLDLKMSENKFIDFIENCPISAREMSDDDFAKLALGDDYYIYFKK